MTNPEMAAVGAHASTLGANRLHRVTRNVPMRPAVAFRTPHHHRMTAAHCCMGWSNTKKKAEQENRGSVVSQSHALADGPATASDDIQPNVSANHSDAQLFNWHRTWYPLAVLEMLRPDAPNSAQLLGTRLVLWRDGGGVWRAHEDVCPHRLAPLSEGRLQDGQLQCTYHGWTFESSGRCTSIPQISNARAHTVACANRRACIKSYPTQVLDGLLWVYADASVSEAEAAAAGPPRNACKELSDGTWKLKSTWYQRDLPLSYEFLFENIADPAHIPHSHHGILGNRNGDHTMSMTLLEPVSRDDGFAVSVTNNVGAGGSKQTVTVEVRPPGHLRWNLPGPARLLMHVIPVSHGNCRLIMAYAGPTDGPSLMVSKTPIGRPPPLSKWFRDNVVDRVPALQHALTRNPAFDGDSILLQEAERVFYERGGASTWKQQFYMPSSADVSVSAWRRWLDRHGAALPVAPHSENDLTPRLAREVVFDRLHQHTQHCPHCRQALYAATAAAVAAAVLAALAGGGALVAATASVAATTAASSAPMAAPPAWLACGLSVMCALCCAAVVGLLKLRQLFIGLDYVHADKH